MSARNFSLRPVNRWLEPLFAVAVIAALVRAGVFFSEHGYLPQPFFYDPSDVWMDWFNTAYWAHNPGAYDAWGTVYPPLTFVMLKIFSIGSCYANGFGGYYAFRSCDWVGTVTFHLIFLLNLILIFLTFRKIDASTAIPRTIAVGIGLPMMFGLERANPFLACFTAILLGFGPLLSSARWKWLAVGLAINFKPYAIAGLFPVLLRRKWRWFEGALILTIVVYVLSYAAFGAGSPGEVLSSLTVERIYDVGNFLDLWFATTYQPLLSLLNTSQIPITSIMGSRNVELLLLIIPIVVRGIQLTIIAAWVAAWLRPEVVPTFRLVGLGLSLAVVSTETSGYSLVLILLFVFMEKWEGAGRIYALVGAYIASIPADIIVGQIGYNVTHSFLSDRTVVVNYGFAIGPLIRPLLFMSLPFALSLTTLRAVWLDVRRQGWKTRWRYRHDLPIMVGAGSARPPA